MEHATVLLSRYYGTDATIKSENRLDGGTREEVNNLLKRIKKWLHGEGSTQLVFKSKFLPG